VARELELAGYDAFALDGGYDAWTALYGSVPKLVAPLVAD
jgi:rhodanese-related sulfurtransferase